MNDEYVVVAQDALTGVNVAGVPGAFWVEYFPFLKNIPGWIPGVTFKKFAKQYKPRVEEMRFRPFQDVRTKLQSDVGIDCVAASLLRDLPEDTTSREYTEKEEIAINTTGVAYAGGADTTTSSAQSFLIAMAMFPDVQTKAQEELDRVVGPDRLPDFNDCNALVYIRAIVLESLRWMPVFPLGLPHSTSEDDDYNDYFIPKGTVVIPNQWAMLHDPKTYPDPEKFYPDRFIKKGEIDSDVLSPSKIAFGFGRRICPGRYLSDNSLFITIASTLHVFNITPAKDENGNPKNLLDVSATTAMMSAPESVPCVLIPRSESAVQLIRESATL